MINGTFTSEKNEKVTGVDIPFTVVCERCNNMAAMEFILFHKTGPYIDPDKIAVEFKCTHCSNRFRGYIYGKPDRPPYKDPDEEVW